MTLKVPCINTCYLLEPIVQTSASYIHQVSEEREREREKGYGRLQLPYQMDAEQGIQGTATHRVIDWFLAEVEGG